MVKQKTKKYLSVALPKSESKEIGEQQSVVSHWYLDFKFQYIIIAILSILFYCNTYNNEYALDDNIVILKNEFVYQGLAGIPDIVTKDAFYSYCKQTNSTNLLAGGRYRPLSIITFAIEQQFLGKIEASDIDSVVNNAGEKGMQQDKLVHDMHIRHGFNVLWFTFSVLVLLYFLRFVVFKANLFIAFIATLLFVIHPIHTEVVANVKSRDEILSLLFICLTFIFAFKYSQKKKIGILFLGLISYFLALLAKEYAITLIVLLPLAFVLFDKLTMQKSLLKSVPYFAVAIIYLAIRLQIVGFNNDVIETDVWNNPYALALGTEKLATEIATSLNYLKLLVFPYPLSSDYSYNTIPYKSFSNPLVWLSVFIHLGLMVGFFYSFKRSKVIAFGLAFYLLNLALVCNVFYNIGGTMGERLIYHSSVGFAIIFAYGLNWIITKFLARQTGQLLVIGILAVLTVIFGVQIVCRNSDWKNDFTLFSKDIKVVPNSLLINANLGAAYVNKADYAKDTIAKKADLQSGIIYLDKAIAIQNTCMAAIINRGLAYFRLGLPDSARENYNKIYELLPSYSQLPDMYYNLGVYYFLHQRFNEAKMVWERTLSIAPNYQMAKNALGVLEHQNSKTN